MNTTWVATPAAVALALALAALPASAQSSNRDRPARDRSAQSARTARQGDAANTQPRGQAVRRAEPRQNTSRETPSSGTRGYTTSRSAPPASGTRGYSGSPSGPPADPPPASGVRGRGPQRGTPPANEPPASGTRGYTTSRGAPRAEAPPVSGTRGYATSRPTAVPRDQRYDRGYSGNDRGYGGYGRSRYGNYNRDAWRGRVHWGLGISIFAGNAFRFHFDYGWRPTFTYHYRMMPGLAYGGMSFVLDPYYTEVYIDGEFVGVSSDFGGQPVPIAAGFHRIELYAPGFVPVAFDIQVRPGQVIPYYGTLYPAY